MSSWVSSWVRDVCPTPNFPKAPRPSMARTYQPRASVTPYDAVCGAPAEQLGCSVPTLDVRLAHAPGLQCPIRVLVN